MITQEVLERFVDLDLKTPAMSVMVKRPNRISDSYIVPSGFQLDLYVNSLFPSFQLKVECFPEKMIVSVMHNNSAIETHEGVFREYYESH